MGKKQKINFDKLCRLDSIANDENWKLKYIFFEEGYVYVANRVVALRANLKDISNLSNESISNLNGKIITPNDYTDILEYDQIDVTPDYIECKRFLSSDPDILTKTIQIFFINEKNENYSEICRFREIMLDTFKNNISNEKKQPNNGIFCLNPYRLNKIINAIGYLGGFAFYNTHRDMNESVLLVPCKSFEEAYDVVAIIKPMMICRQVEDSIKIID